MNTTKRIVSVALICAFSGAMFAQRVTQEERPVSAFTGLDASGAFAIELKKGSQPSVVIEADDIYMQYIKTEVVSGVLRLSFNNPSRTRLRAGATLNACITITDLNYIELSGACLLTSSDRFTPSRLRIDLSGASNIAGLQIDADDVGIEASGASKFEITGNISELKASVSGASKGFFKVTSQQLSASATGASDLTIEGTAHKALIDVTGATTVKANSLTVNELRYSASGASKAYVHVVESLSVKMSGASKLDYKGTPRIVEMQVSTGSSLNRR